MTDERSERLRKRRQRRQQLVSEADESPSAWTCGIGPCSFVGDTVRDLIVHQSRDHPPHTCKVCHRDVPDGFVAIHHTFTEHSRAEYVKAYDASPDEVRRRERIKAEIEQQIDVPALLDQLDGGDRHSTP